MTTCEGTSSFTTCCKKSCIRNTPASVDYEFKISADSGHSINVYIFGTKWMENIWKTRGGTDCPSYWLGYEVK